MREIKTKEEFKNLFHYDRKSQMYIFVITETMIITEEVMSSFPLETLVKIYNEELNIIKKKLIEKVGGASLN